MVKHLTLDELERGLAHIQGSPQDEGVVEMIVCRPAQGAREVLQVGELDPIEGLVGDGWRSRGSSRTPDGSAHPDMQIAIMSVRVIDLIAGDRSRWALAGDQLFLDLDLGRENLPPGTRLAMGTAIVEITAKPHNGCKKFAERFGVDAVAFLSDRRYRHLELRGIYAKVVHRGRLRLHDTVHKL
jgi:hypothetical protein